MIFSPGDGAHLSRGTNIPGDYLFVKADKHDRTLQILLYFLGYETDPVRKNGNIPVLPEEGMNHSFFFTVV
jgi:hypothetical protein